MAPASLPLVALLGAGLLVTATAGAESVTTNGVPDRQCSALSADLTRWTPAAGPPARFVAESFVRSDAHQWLGLGYDGDGFWSAETGPRNDACDACSTLDLVLTRFDGTRRAFPVVSSLDASRLEGQPPEARRDLALQRLWHLAATVWPASTLKQAYAFRLPPKRAADGSVDPYPGWMGEASQRGGWLLRFGLSASPFMCWCHFGWQGWALAAPRK
jgi:hypothetical protein